MAQKIDNSPSKLSYVSSMECLGCGKNLTLKDLLDQHGTIYVNGDENGCGGPLDIRYNMSRVRRVLTLQEVERRYRENPTLTMLQELLPVDKVLIDGSVGFTPLIRAEAIERKIRDLYGKKLTVYLKIEDTPTGSFKFRPTSGAFDKSLEDGNYVYVCTASTFNLGRTTNWLSKKYNRGSLLFIPKSVGEYKVSAINEHSTQEEIEEIRSEDLSDGTKRNELIEKYAQEIVNDIKAGSLRRRVVVFGGSYDEANNFSLYVAERANDLTLTEYQVRKIFIPNSIFRPFYKEFSKTYGYEVLLQLLFDYNLQSDHVVKIILPIGSGALACSAIKGIEELRELDIMNNPVSLYAAQPELVMPVVDAFRRFENTGVREILPGYIGPDGKLIKWKTNETLGQSVAIGNPGSGYQTLELIIKTNGGAISVTERQIVEGLLDLKELENVSAQDVGGVTLAALYNGIETRGFNDGDVVVVGVTGVGLELVKDKVKEFAKGTDLEKRVAGSFN